MTDSAADRDLTQADRSQCCIVGSGPAGMVLAYVLAREGVDVTLLEAHADFNRSFRGDTVHPSTLELLDQLGLAEKALNLPHTRMERFGIQTSEGRFYLAEFAALRSKFPFIAMIDQARFLDFLASEAAAYPSFQLRMNANGKEIVEENGRSVGVRYQSRDGWREVRADLVVAADGRHSVLRKKAGLEPIPTSAPMDVLWFRLPKRETDAGLGEGVIRVGHGHLTVTLEREDHWQVALVIRKGGYHELKEKGIDGFRETVVATVPEYADRMDAVTSWKDVAVLDVESSRLACWHKPGLLFIGDAAHTMSPVGGMGINYAIQDAIVAANVLTTPLLEGTVTDDHLAEIQRQREPAVRFAQTMQSIIQQRIIGRGLADTSRMRPPFLTRFRLFRKLAARFIGYGLRPAKLATPSVVRPCDGIG